MRAHAAPSRSKGRIVKWLLTALLVAAAMAPGIWWPAYFRILATACLGLLAVMAARALVAAVASWRRPRAPPAQQGPWPSVSVLVPAFNEAATLPSALASLQRLSYPGPLEFVYVAELRSSDGTVQVLERAAAADPRIHVVRRDSDRGGKAAACNDGMAHCTGDLVWSLDADHRPEPEALQRAVRWFQDPRVQCVKGRVIAYNAQESLLALQQKVERDAIEKGDIYSRQVMRGYTFFGGGQALFRRSVFTTLGAFDEEMLTEDTDFSARLHEHGHGLVVDPGVVTREENPADLAGWWAQRKRWARGWMQSAVRHVPTLLLRRGIRAGVRLDGLLTLLYVLIPVLFILVAPLLALGLAGVDTRAYGGAVVPWLWRAVAAAPVILAASVLLQDLRDREGHLLRELPALLTLWPYLAFQTVVFWSAFLDEFVLRRKRVYVKTVKTGGVRSARPSPTQ